VKAKKIKVYIKTNKVRFPIPAVRFSTLRRILKLALKYTPKCIDHANGNTWRHLRSLSAYDIDQIIDQLQIEEPFELVDIKAYDGNEGSVIVKVYTE